MMYRKDNERSLRAALDITQNKITKKHAAVEVTKLNRYVHNISLEELDLHFERLQLNSEVLTLPFEGVVNIPATEGIAIKLATEASEAAFDPSNRILFTEKNQASSAPGDEPELIAISRCLGLVTSDILHAPTQKRAPKITVFTHCQGALRRLDGARNIGQIRSTSTSHYTQGALETTPALVDVVKKSRFLCRKLGAKLTLQWMPHHASADRHRLAEAATTPPAMPAPKRSLPSLQHLRRDKTLKPCQRAHLRRQLAQTRRPCHGGPSRLAQEATQASSTRQQDQTESVEQLAERLSNVRISADRHFAVWYD